MGSKCWKCGAETIQPAEGWIYPAIPDIDRVRKLAFEVGYAIAAHGSMERDVDLVAVPWVEDAIGNHALMEHIAKGMNGKVLAIEKKPLGRYACTIQIDGWYKDIDLSVCPRIELPTSTN